MNPGVHCTGQMVDGVYGIVGEWFVNVNVQCAVLVVGYGMGKHRTGEGGFY